MTRGITTERSTVGPECLTLCIAKRSSLALVLLLAVALAGCVTMPTSSGTASGPGAQGVDVAYDSDGKRAIKVRQTDRGTVIAADEKVFFESGKHELSAAGKDVLGKVADILKNRTNANVSIEGHTDNVGGAELNRQLSLRRANAVRDHLVTVGGVPAQRLKAEGLGMSRPVATNDTAEGRQANRRTDIVVLGEKQENLSKPGEPSLGESLSAGLDKFLKDSGTFFKNVFGGKKE